MNSQVRRKVHCILVNFVAIYKLLFYCKLSLLNQPTEKIMSGTLIFHVAFKACIFKADIHFSYTQISTYQLAVQTNQVPTEETYIAQSSYNMYIKSINTMLSTCVISVPMFSRQV